MNLSNLVNQLITEPPPKKISTRSLICQKCKMQPRAIAIKSGKMADYCKACKRDLAYASNARRMAK